MELQKRNVRFDINLQTASSDQIEIYGLKLLAIEQQDRVLQFIMLINKYGKISEVATIAEACFQRYKDPVSLNLFFSAVCKMDDFEKKEKVAADVTKFLETTPYEEPHIHLYGTLLKYHVVRHQPKEFLKMYSRIPEDEKNRNSYIIENYYKTLDEIGEHNSIVVHYDNLAPSVKRLDSMQGSKNIYESAKKQLEEQYHSTSSISIKQDEATTTKRVFLVYGTTDQLFMRMVKNIFLTIDDIELVVLDELSGGGRTIIEKFEQYATDISHVVIIFSPDDVGYRKGEEDKKKSRARQNVIFELGYFIGKLSREKIIVINRDIDSDDFEWPSDLHGIQYVTIALAKLNELIGELKSWGLNVEFEKIYKAVQDYTIE